MTAQASRPWRNLNPGDLRTLPPGQHWIGQTGTDNGPGGPFAIFGTERDGWGAVATCLMAYQDLHGLHTVRGIIGRYAPAFENDLGGYVSLVCRTIGVQPDDAINVHTYQTMHALVLAIGLAEGGRSLAWSEVARTDGITAALARANHGAITPPSPMKTTPPVIHTDVAHDDAERTEALNVASLAAAKGH